MRVTLVSNYINHHQIPFADEMYRLLNGEFYFIQTEPMEEDRVRMGWSVNQEKIPYLRLLDQNTEECSSLIMDSDLVIFGGTSHRKLIYDRMEARKLTFFYSERLYREGQWKFISPRGLISKYREYTRYRKYPAYLLCAGSYVASDFHLIHAFSQKMMKWGYFPEFEKINIDELLKEKQARYTKSGVLEILWAGRFMPLKHPEYALRIARQLHAEEKKVHLTLIGGGELQQQLTDMVKQYHMDDYVTMPGFLNPSEVREYMKKADLYLFTSNHLEGWGAVVNEAMNSGCVVASGLGAGATRYLIQDGMNGIAFKNEYYMEMERKVKSTLDNMDAFREMAKKAYSTIENEWNSFSAANKIITAVTQYEKQGTIEFSESGPFSKAEYISPLKMNSSSFSYGYHSYPKKGDK